MGKFLIKSKDNFQIDTFLSNLTNRFPGYSILKFYDMESFLPKITEYSLFDDTKYIFVLMDFNTDCVKYLNSALEGLTDDPIVLIQGKAITKTKGYTNITVDFEVISLEPLKTKDFSSWVTSTLKNKNVKFSSGVPEYISLASGHNQYRALNEIEKISLLKDSITFDSKNISSYVSGETTSDFFGFFDDLTHLRKGETLNSFKKISPSEYTGLVILIISQFERLYRISLYRSKKIPTEEIASIFNIPEFIIKTKILTVFAFMSKIKILKSIDIFVDLSGKIRSSKVDKTCLFEQAILKVLKND